MHLDSARGQLKALEDAVLAVHLNDKHNIQMPDELKEFKKLLDWKKKTILQTQKLSVKLDATLAKLSSGESSVQEMLAQAASVADSLSAVTTLVGVAMKDSGGILGKSNGVGANENGGSDPSFDPGPDTPWRPQV